MPEPVSTVVATWIHVPVGPVAVAIVVNCSADRNDLLSIVLKTCSGLGRLPIDWIKEVICESFVVGVGRKISLFDTELTTVDLAELLAPPAQVKVLVSASNSECTHHYPRMRYPPLLDWP